MNDKIVGHSTKNARKYTIRLVIIFTVYTALIFLINGLGHRFELTEWQRLGMSFLPVLPAIAMIFAAISFVRTMDEVQQRIITESALIAAGIVGIGTFILGFMEEVVVLPDNLLEWIFPAMIALHGIAMVFVRLRYR